MDEFFRTHGYDANIVDIYDDCIEHIASVLDATIIPCKLPLEDIIRKRQNLTAQLFKNDKTILHIQIPTGSKYYQGKYDIKGYFIVRGLSYVFVSMDQAFPSYPIVRNINKKLVCTYNFVDKGFSRYLKLEINNVGKIIVSFYNERHSLSSFFAYINLAYSDIMSDINVLRDYVNACHKLCSNIPNKSFIYEVCINIESEESTKLDHEYANKIKVRFSYDEIVNVIAFMAIKLVNSSLTGHIDDIDDESFKRVQCAGPTIFNMIYRNIYSLDNNTYHIDNISNVGENIQKMFLNSKVANLVGSMKKGVTQELESVTIISSLSHIRRIKVYMSEDEAPYRVREYNRNHRGYTCCYETSDSKSAGLNKVLAWTCLITRHTLNPHIIQQVKFDSIGIPVFHNGRMIGYIDNPPDDLSDKSPNDTWSVYVKQGVLCIHNDVGRLTRPMLYKGNKVMIDMGEYIKFHNQLNEIYPSSMLGLSALLTTFPHMSPGPRNNYQTSMNKQAISWCPNKFHSTRHEEKILLSPDMPYVLTDFAKHYLEEFLDLRHTNVVVAVMSDMHNNEDAIIINKGAVQRGLFSNIKIINERVFLKETSNRTQSEIKQLRTGEKLFIRTNFNTTNNSIIYENGNYSKDNGDSYVYNENGSINPWNILYNGDVIQSMLDTTKIQPRRDFKYEQIHPIVTFRNRINNTNQLDEVYSEIIGFRFRIPEPGDKFATDISQKGVCAILKDESDMIQLPDGTIPHIVINPHGFPSRMTVGTLLNMAIGKYLCRVHDLNNIKEYLQSMNGCNKLKNIVLGWNGYFHSVNASIFSNMDKLIDIIKEYDVSENVFHGNIGLWTKKPVYYGILPYIALKQQIDEKSAARLTGPIVPMTGQPILGRKKGGGSALGEMEVNALIAYNAMGILYERMTLIDKTSVKYCPNCFLINVVDNECNKCKNKLELINSRVSFITFVNLLYSMGLLCKVEL